MSKYFDRDFFRFFLGFMAIISTSLIIIIATRLYADMQINEEVNKNTPEEVIQNK